jgi:hypothetical protein
MQYDYAAIPQADPPHAAGPSFQRMLETSAGETNKVISVWRCFSAQTARSANPTAPIESAT